MKNAPDCILAGDKLDDVRGGIVLTKGEMLHANNLWKTYSPSRLNDWEDCN